MLGSIRNLGTIMPPIDDGKISTANNWRFLGTFVMAVGGVVSLNSLRILNLSSTIRAKIPTSSLARRVSLIENYGKQLQLVPPAASTAKLVLGMIAVVSLLFGLLAKWKASRNESTGGEKSDYFVPWMFTSSLAFGSIALNIAQAVSGVALRMKRIRIAKDLPVLGQQKLLQEYLVLRQVTHVTTLVVGLVVIGAGISVFNKGSKSAED